MPWVANGARERQERQRRRSEATARREARRTEEIRQAYPEALERAQIECVDTVDTTVEQDGGEEQATEEVAGDEVVVSEADFDELFEQFVTY